MIVITTNADERKTDWGRRPIAHPTRPRSLGFWHFFTPLPREDHQYLLWTLVRPCQVRRAERRQRRREQERGRRGDTRITPGSRVSPSLCLPLFLYVRHCKSTFWPCLACWGSSVWSPIVAPSGRISR